MEKRNFLAVTLVLCMQSSWAAPAKQVAEHTGKINAKFDPMKMSDMSNYDSSNLVIPTGDTIRIAVVATFLEAGSWSKRHSPEWTRN